MKLFTVYEFIISQIISKVLSNLSYNMQLCISDNPLQNLKDNPRSEVQSLKSESEVPKLNYALGLALLNFIFSCQDDPCPKSQWLDYGWRRCNV